MKIQIPSNNFLFYYCVGKSIKKKHKNPNSKNLMNTVFINYCKNWRQVSEKVQKTFDNI